MVRINDATGTNITVIKDRLTLWKSFLLILFRSTTRFIMNMITYMVIGGDVQDPVGNGNLSMVMLNDQ